ncbi:HAD-IIIA family hydrolase [Desulfobacula phenolica]|uniref:D,D-heptose 1,7-bisphosphate phosphatase n=1 Tax=Desulfobacula phenolica TaxID=90732 RepID=A0A1H2DRT1_9BACT|nr:HAD-IIIA family hydrolase [Desulfobacula phenolica]SDT85597.1 D,D-heptose 1,7-bisphosphate phosphatase [Desulfobacula phenolica]
MDAVLLAGGKGTRLGPLTTDLPKPMIPIGGMPVLEHHIRLLAQYGITDIFVLTGYLGHRIEAYFGNGNRLGCRINYIQESIPLGTGGALKQLENRIDEDFLLIFGDVFFDIKLDDFISFHKLSKGVASFIVHPSDHPYDSDLVAINEDKQIISFLLKPHKVESFGNLGNAGVYMLAPKVFQYIKASSMSDLMKDIFPAMLDKSEKMYAYRTAEYLKDMGTVDRLERVKKDYSSGKTEKLSKKNKRPAVFIDRDGTLIKDVHLLHRTDQLELYDFSASALGKVNQSDYLSILVTNQSVVARNLCTISGLKNIHDRMETLLGEKGVYLDDIMFCPHHPDKGYIEENHQYKRKCTCRKPEIGMIQQAQALYNIDLEKSWLIGDSSTDVQTGYNAGIKTILVRTGKGGLDGKCFQPPDYFFSDLNEAADFILKGKQVLENTILQILKGLRFDDKMKIILVGGLARSGKTTFIKCLQNRLQIQGIDSRLFSIDNWLVGADQRNDSMGVKDRYPYNQIEKDIFLFIQGKLIIGKKYDPYSRETSRSGSIQYKNEKCLLIEGVPALDIKGLRDIAHLKIYYCIDEKERKNRFYSFYRWKGFTEAEIDCLYKKRMKDELPTIKKTRKYADIQIINNSIKLSREL